MNISAPFIARPVATTLLTIGVALAGIMAFALLPVASLPKIDQPAISVSANLPGASPEVMATTVATPLERHLNSIADVTEMTSNSSQGRTNIQLVFGLDRDIDGAARDVQAAIQGARIDLPTSLRNPPQYRKANTAGMPIVILAMTSDTLNQGQIYDAAATVVQQVLSQVDGVGTVNIANGALPAVRVELNPTALFKYGIGLADVQAALSNANAFAPKGSIEEGDRHLQIYTNDQADRAAQYRPLIVAYRNDVAGRPAPVRLSDIAEVTDKEDGATENLRTFGILNGKPAIQVQVLQQPGANIIATVDRIKAMVPQLQASIDPQIDIIVANDRTVTIRASIRQVERTLLLAVALVVLVVFMFLRSPRAALIPAVAVPVSLIGTFGAMYLLGYTLDNFSLMSLTIATGFVVDDAIVVMENTMRHIEEGTPRLQAAFRGAREVGFTVLSMSVSLVAVFLPLQLLGGIIGRLFQEFTMTLSVAILISMVISLTTTPMMCSLLLGREKKSPHSRVTYAFAALSRVFEWGFQKMLDAYERSLAWALAHGPLIMAMLVATIAFNVYLYMTIPKGLFPTQDIGLMGGFVRGDASSSFYLMKDKLIQAATIIQADPAVETVIGNVGGGGMGGAAAANLNITLKPLSERKESIDQVNDRLRPKLAAIQGVQAGLQPQQDLRIGGRGANAVYQYTLEADDLAELRSWAEKLRQALQDVPEVTDVDTDQQPGGLERDVVVDRDTASRLGLTENQIDSTLQNAFAQRLVSTIYNERNQYHVVMEVAPRYWADPETLKDLFISTSGGPVSGTAATNAVAGTTSLTATSNSASSVKNAAASVASNAARNASANALANAGKGGASTGSAVSSSVESMVPLASIAHFTDGTTPTTVNHQGTTVATTIAFNLPTGESLSTAVAAIGRTMNQIGVPATIHGSFQGTARSFAQLLDQEPLLLLASLVAVYIVLGILYESYIHPITIISTLPSAGVGALLALMATGNDFSLIAFIGILLLIGIVKKNAIMMIDFALDGERTLGLDSHDAITRACLLRFRPIMMTTFAALLAAIPLATAAGDGTELRRPLGISIIGGLMLSQALTLYTTPVIYLYIDRVRQWRKRRSQRWSAGINEALPG